MRHEEVIISGFGGQGALFAGQVLAYAGMEEGLHVTWIPSYGPEMRGGTARVTVILSEEEIGSPLVRNPSAVIALNLPSLDRFEPAIKPGGTLIVNRSVVPRDPTRTDLRIVQLPANDLAEKLGNVKMANLVLLGALIEATGIVSLEAAKKALEKHLAERHRHLLEANKEALETGARLAREQLTGQATAAS